MDLKEVIYETIKSIEQGKESSNIEPKNALMKEIERELITIARNDINNLVKENKIGFGKTLNDKYFYIKK